MAIEKVKIDKDVLGNPILLMQGELGEIMVVPVTEGALQNLETQFAMTKADAKQPGRMATPPDAPMPT